MKMKYNLEINNAILEKVFQRIINQVYKLLPLREQGQNWEKPLKTIIEQLVGMNRFFIGNESELFFKLLCKLEGLFELTKTYDFIQYRRIIFQCLSLLGQIEKNVKKLE